MVERGHIEEVADTISTTSVCRVTRRPARRCRNAASLLPPLDSSMIDDHQGYIVCIVLGKTVGDGSLSEGKCKNPDSGAFRGGLVGQRTGASQKVMVFWCLAF
jgi:uncharacterized protein YcfJ